MKHRLNFAPEPFRERSPLLGLLWAVNLVLLAGLAFLVWRWQELRTSNEGIHEQLNELRQQQTVIVEQNDSFIREIDGLDLKKYRKDIEQFQGIQLSVQTQWVSLLDHLGATLPEDVRLIRLSPSFSSKRDFQEVRLKLEAETRNKDAQLTFMRALNESKHFNEVRFEKENYQKEGVALGFELSFTYVAGGGKS